MKNQRSIKLGDLKSIFLTDSSNGLLMAVYTDSSYVYIKLQDDQLQELIDCLNSFQKETV
jgi:hypothetical protein